MPWYLDKHRGNFTTTLPYHLNRQEK